MGEQSSRRDSLCRPNLNLAVSGRALNATVQIDHPTNDSPAPGSEFFLRYLYLLLRTATTSSSRSLLILQRENVSVYFYRPNPFVI